MEMVNSVILDILFLPRVRDHTLRSCINIGHAFDLKISFLNILLIDTQRINQHWCPHLNFGNFSQRPQHFIQIPSHLDDLTIDFAGSPHTYDSAKYPSRCVSENGFPLNSCQIHLFDQSSKSGRGSPRPGGR